MAVKQSMKPPVPAKTTASKKKAPEKLVETPAPKPKGRVASKVTKSAPTSSPAAKPPRATRPPKAVAPTVSEVPVVSSNSATPSAELLPQMLIQQQAIQTQAWMTNEITQLREQLLAAQQTPPAAAPSDQSSLLAEIDRLQKENADLREKAERLDQMASLLQGNSAVALTSLPAPAKTAKPEKTVKTVKTANAKVQAVAKAPVKTPVSKTPVTTARKSRGGVSILQEAAIADVNRTYKSCWPIVFKIEEWNQKHPNQLAKVSQTMLNKSGVNFSRAKGFMENYGDLVESYHQQIGLSKVNSGKFNEVYEFIRASLGKGKKV